MPAERDLEASQAKARTATRVQLVSGPPTSRRAFCEGAK
jgi:hypothetical protein